MSSRNNKELGIHEKFTIMWIMTKIDDIYIIIKSQNNMKQWNNILNHLQKQTRNEPPEYHNSQQPKLSHILVIKKNEPNDSYINNNNI